MNKPRVAWFSPTSLSSLDAGSVSCYATSLLLPALVDRFEIELFEDGFTEHELVPSHHFLQAFRRHRQKPFDLFFYQLEDRASSNFIRIHLGLIPGVVWFHDYLLSTDGPEPILNSGWSDTVSHFREEQDDFPERGKEYTRVGPHARREGAYALAALFSSMRDHYEYRAIAERGLLEHCLSYYLPLPVSLPSSFKRKTSCEKLLVGACCPPFSQFRVHKVLQAMTLCSHQTELVWLIESNEREQAESLLQEFQLDSRVRLIEGRTPARWYEFLVDIDVCLHTLFSSFGHLEPYLSMSLAFHKPIITSSFGSTGFIPEEVAFLVDPGETEAQEMAALFNRFAEARLPLENRIGRRYAEENLATEVVAKELSSVFTEFTRERGPFALQKWESFLLRGRRSLLAEVQQLFGPDWKSVCQPVFSELGWSLSAEEKR